MSEKPELYKYSQDVLSRKYWVVKFKGGIRQEIPTKLATYIQAIETENERMDKTLKLVSLHFPHVVDQINKLPSGGG